MCSHPSVVRFFQIGELDSSLGGAGTESYARDHVSLAHRLFGKGYCKPRRLSHLSTEPCSAEFSRKSNSPIDPMKFE